MAEQYIQPPFHPESFEYGIAAVTMAATTLQENINDLAATSDPTIAVEIKTDPFGVNSPVTKYDKATEQLIGWTQLPKDARPPRPVCGSKRVILFE